MSPKSPLQLIPVLSSADIDRDLVWYDKYVGFNKVFGDAGYAGLQRENHEIHLQWHHANDNDPVFPSVIKLFVPDIQLYAEEFIERGTISREKLRMHTPWGTHEFGFYDLNKNAIFIVQDV